MRRTAGAFLAAIAAVGVAVQPRANAEDDPLALALLSQDFAIAPDGILRLEYELTGTIPDSTPPSTAAPSTTATTATTAATAATPPITDPALTVLVTAFERISLRSDVSDVLGGGVRSAIDSAEYDLVDVIGAEQNGTTSSRWQLILDVQTTTSGEVRGELALPRAGLYPVTVEIRQGRRSLVEHVTFIERLATPDSGAFPRSTLNLSIVAGIPDPGPDTDALDLVESNARATELAQLGELIAAPLTVSVPPVVAAALAADPELAARLRTALSGDEVLALPESRLDPSSAVAADQVEAFTRELREGEDALRRALPSTATRRVAWLTTEPLSEGGASMLRDLGVQLVVMPFDLYLALESNQSATIRTDLTDPTLLLSGELAGGGELALSVVDPINELLETDRVEEGTPAEVAAHLFAELMAMRIQLGPDSRSFVLATPDLGIPDPDVLAVIERFVLDHPDVDFQTLSFVPGTTGPFLVNGDRVRVTFPPTAGPDLTRRVHEIDLVRLHMAHAATMLPADDPRPQQWRTELESLMSTGIDDVTVTGRLGQIERALQDIEQAIEPPAPFTFTLAGDASPITLRFRNTSSTALRINVRVSGPSRLTFPQPDTGVTLLPDATTDVTIPIEARSNGTSEVTVEVLTPSGAVIGEPIVLTARVNALSGLGQLLTGAALLVLATWWFSHFRRKRRQRHSGPSRNDHPSNVASGGGPHPITVAATDSTDRSSANGDVSPDAAVASSSLEQTEGYAPRPVTVSIVTDSACDLPESVATDLHIAIVPLTIRFGDAEFIDRVELTTAEFWAKASGAATLPATAAPAPGAFEEAYRKAAAAGATGVVVVSLSGALSATMQSAEVAARSVADEIAVRVVDSRSVSLGLGTIVVECARRAAEGGDVDEIAALATDLASRTRVFGALDTLENLKKGGRIGNAKALLATALAIKPIIEVIDGKVEQGGKQRTRSKALAFLVDKVREYEGRMSSLAVLHANCSDVDQFVEMLRPLYGGEIIVGEIGPVIGTHAGRGTIGVAFTESNG